MLAQGVDFADALHLASNGGAERFVTFDAMGAVCPEDVTGAGRACPMA